MWGQNRGIIGRLRRGIGSRPRTTDAAMLLTRLTARDPLARVTALSGTLIVAALVRTGRGVVATHDDRRIAVGTVELMMELGIDVSEGAAERLAEPRATGKTAVLVSLDDDVLGVLGIADVPRSKAAVAVARLPRLGIRRTVMLTRDHGRTADAVASAVGTPEVHAELLPEAKLGRIRALQAEGHVVAMVSTTRRPSPPRTWRRHGRGGDRCRHRDRGYRTPGRRAQGERDADPRGLGPGRDPERDAAAPGVEVGGLGIDRSGQSRTLRSSCAFSATMTVLADMRTAPTAGCRTMPHRESTPAASGIATML